MKYSVRALAVDFDGTLTQGSRPGSEVLEAIRDARDSGLKVILVTGRILSELVHAFRDVALWFDVIVSENGAVVTRNGRTRVLAPPVPPVLEDVLNRRGIPVRGGMVLLACDSIHDHVVLEEISRLGLECVVVRNRAALMVLPTGVSKGAGVREALGDLGLSHHDAVGVGDAENDHSLLDACEVGVAVANAVDGLKAQAGTVLEEPDGRGILALLNDGLLTRPSTALFTRHVTIGETTDGRAARLPTARYNLLVTGDSMAGKSYVAGLFAESLILLGYSMLVVDLEGDHLHLASLQGVLAISGGSRWRSRPKSSVCSTAATRAS